MTWGQVVQIIGLGLAGGVVTYVVLGSVEWLLKRSGAWR